MSPQLVFYTLLYIPCNLRNVFTSKNNFLKLTKAFSTFCKLFCEHDFIDLCDVRDLPVIGDLNTKFPIGRFWRFQVRSFKMRKIQVDQDFSLFSNSECYGSTPGPGWSHGWGLWIKRCWQVRRPKVLESLQSGVWETYWMKASGCSSVKTKSNYCGKTSQIWYQFQCNPSKQSQVAKHKRYMNWPKCLSSLKWIICFVSTHNDTMSQLSDGEGGLRCWELVGRFWEAVPCHEGWALS